MPSLDPDARASDAPVYLDNAATTRLDAAVLEELIGSLRGTQGNPSSAHGLGAEASAALSRARQATARALSVEPNEILFSSGGSESNNIALRGAALALARRGRHIVTTSLEHPCVLETCRALRDQHGFELSEVTPETDGQLDARRVLAAVRPDTVLVSTMHVQNETGALLPVAEIAAGLRARSALAVMHIDGVQAAGKGLTIPKGAHLYSVSAHKLHGPKGVGALMIRRGTRLRPFITGGGQEHGLRSGTENLPSIVAFAKALELAVARAPGFRSRWQRWCERLRSGILALGGVLNGPVELPPVPIINASFPGLPSEALMHALEARGVFVSNGSACASRRRDESHVLTAMGVPPERRKSALRFSFAYDNHEHDSNRAVEALGEALQELEPLRRGPPPRRARRATQ